MSDNPQQVINHYLSELITTEQQILEDKQGISGLLANSLYGGLGGWMMVANVFILLMTGLLLFSAFQFFNANSMENTLFWGICLVAALQIQIAIKQWLWSQMNRCSILREIKRTQRVILTDK